MANVKGYDASGGTWFGMQVWNSSEAMRAAGVESGPYWHSGGKDGARVLKYMTARGGTRQAKTVAAKISGLPNPSDPAKTFGNGAPNAETTRRAVNATVQNMINKERNGSKRHAERKKQNREVLRRLAENNKERERSAREAAKQEEKAARRAAKEAAREAAKNASRQNKERRKEARERAARDREVIAAALKEAKNAARAEMGVQYSKVEAKLQPVEREQIKKRGKNNGLRGAQKFDGAFANVKKWRKKAVEAQYPTLMVPVAANASGIVYYEHLLTKRRFSGRPGEKATRFRGRLPSAPVNNNNNNKNGRSNAAGGRAATPSGNTAVNNRNRRAATPGNERSNGASQLVRPSPGARLSRTGTPDPPTGNAARPYTPNKPSAARSPNRGAATNASRTSTMNNNNNSRRAGATRSPNRAAAGAGRSTPVRSPTRQPTPGVNGAAVTKLLSSALARELIKLGIAIRRIRGVPRGEAGGFIIDELKRPPRIEFVHTRNAKRVAVLGATTVFAQYHRMHERKNFPANLSVDQRMHAAAQAIQNGKLAAVQKNKTNAAEHRAALELFGAQLTSSGSNTTAGNTTASAARVPSHGIKDYLFRVFSETGYKKHWQVTGVAGAFTKKSLFQQLQDWSSPNPPDGCKFRPLSLMQKDVSPIMPHQAVVHALAHLRATNRISTPGLLAFHSTGSGKTLESLAVVVQFWHTPYAIFSCSTRSNQSGNDLLTLARLARKHFSYVKTGTGTGASAAYGFAGDVALAYETLAERLIAGYKSIIDGPTKFKAWLDRAGLSANPQTRRDRYREYLQALADGGRSKKLTTALTAGRKVESRLLATYTTFVNDLPDFKGITRVSIADHSVSGKLHNAVWILDEVQFLVGTTASTERGFKDHYRTVKTLLTKHRDDTSTWVFAATATPGTNFKQFKDILNIVGGTSQFSNPKLTVEQLRTDALCQKLISYVDMAGNRAQFAAHDVAIECVDVWSNDAFGERYFKYVMRLEHMPDGVRQSLRKMFASRNRDLFESNTERQAGYVVSRRVTNKNTGNVALVPKELTAKTVRAGVLNYNVNNANSNPASFYRHLRRAAMFLSSPSEKRSGIDIKNKHKQYSPTVFTIGELKTANGLGSAEGKKHAIVVGPKITLLLQRIKENPKSLHYVYATDSESIKLIAYLLKRDLGMSVFGRGAASPAGTFGFVNDRKLNDSKDKFKEFNDWTAADVRRIIDTASSDRNITGAIVRVLLATKDAFKGVDVGNIRHLHLLDPMIDFQHYKQFTGRGPRFCSHKHFSKMASRRVVTHVYRIQSSTWKGDPAVYADHVTWERSWQQYKRDWGAVLEVVRDIAVDSKLFSPTFHKAVATLEKGLHEQPCELRTATFLKVNTARANNNNNNNNAANNNAANNMNANENANAAPHLADVKRIPLEILAKNGPVQARLRTMLKNLVNDPNAETRRFVQLQRKLSSSNGVNAAEFRELTALQRAVAKNPKHAEIFQKI